MTAKTGLIAWALAGLLALASSALAQTAALLPPGELQFNDANGAPLAGGSACFYQPGTLTAKTTWLDPYQATANPAPCVGLDSAGRAVVYGSGQYRERVLDLNGNLVWDQLTNGIVLPAQGNYITGPSVSTVGVIPAWTNSTGTALGNSYTVGTGAGDLVQLTGTGALPAVNGSNLSGIGNSPGGVFTGLEVDTTGSATTAITANAVSLANGTGGYIAATNVSCTVTLSSSGAGGLDTGSPATSTWYYFWVISTGSSTSCEASLQSTANSTFTGALPTGYTYFARVGVNTTDGSANLKRVIQFGRRAQYVVTATTNTATLPVVATGTAGSTTIPTYVAITVAGNGYTVPPTASRIAFIVFIGSASGTETIIAPNNAYGAYGSTSNLAITVGGVGTDYHVSLVQELGLESTSIYWATNDNSIIAVYGWEDNL